MRKHTEPPGEAAMKTVNQFYNNWWPHGFIHPKKPERKPTFFHW